MSPAQSSPPPATEHEPDAPPRGTTDLARVIRHHQAGIWRYLRLLGCDREATDDLTQETFLRLLRSEFEFYDEKRTWSYLRTTARHLFLQSLRHREQVAGQSRAELVDEATAEMPDETGAAWLAALRSCLRQLGERPRTVVRLFYREGLSRNAIAENLGLRETGVKTLLQRTRATLRDCIRGEVQ